MAYESIVAGAGIWGCTVARRLAEKGRRVLVLEKRPVVGGNVRCEIDPATGIEIHTYGSHIFHTHLPEVWAFVNRFVSFNGYQHKVIARHDGKHYFLPLGLTLINRFFDVELKPSEVDAFMSDESRKQALFDAFFRNYTSKQWGKAPEEIDPSIIRRVPVRATYDVNYFNDCWQGIPSEGYNSLFERLLDHPNITVETNRTLTLADLSNTHNPITHNPTTVYYSGPLDALFGFKYGPLPWRTLRFETERVPVKDAQGTSVVNYVDADAPWTRQHEYKHYHPEGVLAAKGLTPGAKAWGWDKDETLVCREYSATWKPGDEPYYPVNDADSEALLEKYREEAKAYPNLVVGGRLGAYRYFDMDKSIEAALNLPLE